MDEDLRPKNVRSHFEAGISLLYGEIGELLSRLEALQARWPEQVAQADAQLAAGAARVERASQGIENATQRHKAVIKKYAQLKLDESLKSIHGATQEELERLNGLVVQTMSENASRSLMNEITALQSATFALETAACRLRFPWKIIGALMLAAGILGGGLGSVLIYFVMKH